MPFQNRQTPLATFNVSQIPSTFGAKKDQNWANVAFGGQWQKLEMLKRLKGSGLSST